MLALAIIALAGACLNGTAAPARAPGEPAPQVLREASVVLEPRASFDGSSFPLAALDAPADAEDQVGPKFDALRREIARYTGEVPEYPAARAWRLVDRQDDRLLFLADSDNGLIYLTLRRRGNDWGFANSGDCQLHAVLGEEIGAAQWWLDPRRPAPTAESTALEILVEERACASGSFAVGRIVPPLVRYGADTITITLGVRVIGGTCPSNPATPAVLFLSEPLGERELLDGFHIPPAPAQPPR